MDRGIAVLGIALAPLGIAAAESHWPVWIANAGTLCGVFLLGVAAHMFPGRSDRADGRASEIPTSLPLQFYGDQRIPTAIQEENILSWYALWSPSAEIVAIDAHGQPIERRVFPKNWYLFTVSKTPTKYQQLVVSFDSPGLPPHEVKHATDRFTIVTVSGDITPGVLAIHARP